jgi:hypothetical protein
MSRHEQMIMARWFSTAASLRLFGTRAVPVPAESGTALASSVDRIFHGEPLHASPEDALTQQAVSSPS